MSRSKILKSRILLVVFVVIAGVMLVCGYRVGQGQAQRAIAGKGRKPVHPLGTRESKPLFDAKHVRD